MHLIVFANPLENDFATSVRIAVTVLNRMLDLGRPESVRAA